MKKVIAFDVDQTVNVAKTPITEEMAKILIACTEKFELAPISGQKYEQFLVQIIEPMVAVGATDAQLEKMHLFVTQGTRYYRYDVSKKDWGLVYKYDLDEVQALKMTSTLEQAAKELGFWVELDNGDEIIENRVSQVTYSALGQKAGTEEKYAWDPDHKKREAIVVRAKELAPEFYYEIGGTTSINAALPGTNKAFGMEHMMKELKAEMSEIIYFGDMTQPGGNDYPVVQMGFDTITVRDWQETANVMRGILYCS